VPLVGSDHCADHELPALYPLRESSIKVEKWFKVFIGCRGSRWLVRWGHLVTKVEGLIAAICVLELEGY